MREAVVVSTARTPIGKAYRGAFNDTQAQALGGHAIRHAVARAGIEPGEVEDVVMGAALQQGSTHMNTARQWPDSGGPAGIRTGYERGPAMRIRDDGHRHRGQIDRRGWLGYRGGGRAGIHLVGPE